MQRAASGEISIKHGQKISGGGTHLPGRFTRHRGALCGMQGRVAFSRELSQEGFQDPKKHCVMGWIQIRRTIMASEHGERKSALTVLL
jgi:hypothetical protein